MPATARYQGPAGLNTCTSGSAVAKARMIPPSATDSSPAPTRSAWRAEAHQLRRSTSGRLAVSSRASSRSASSTVTTPIGESQIEPPDVNGTNGPPSSTEVTRLRGWRITSSSATRVSGERGASPIQSKPRTG